MKKILEHLIQKIYRRYRNNYYRKILTSLSTDFKHLELFESNLKEPFIHFAGFEISYDWYGSTLSRECDSLGETTFYEHLIFLNQCFAYNLTGYAPNKNNTFARSCTFTKLIETIAHEVAHALLIDLYPQEPKHKVKQEEIIKELKKYLWEDKLVKQLEKKWKEVN